jgi:Fic family protein
MLRSVAIVESTESSNRLEGIVVSRERIKDIVLKSSRLRSRSEQEVGGYRDALAMIHGSWETLVFDAKTIKLIHSVVYKYLPGEGGDWKKRNNVILERKRDGSERVRFVPVSAADTPKAMGQLAERYENALRDGSDPLVIIPLAVFDFLCIHPFKDGNGRVARLITLLLLYQAGYQVGRYISLERIFEESAETYYETLEMSSEGWHKGEHDIMPWLTYFWGVLIRAYKEFEERIGKVVTVRGSKSEQVRLAVGRQIKPFSISDIEDACPTVSRDMVRHVLNKMREEGLIRLAGKGRGRGAKWEKLREKKPAEKTE